MYVPTAANTLKCTSLAAVNAGHCTVTDVCPCGMMPMLKPSGSSAVLYRTTKKLSSTWLALVAVTVARCVLWSMLTDNPVGVVSAPTAARVACPYVVLRSCTVLMRTKRHWSVPTTLSILNAAASLPSLYARVCASVHDAPSGQVMPVSGFAKVYCTLIASTGCEASRGVFQSALHKYPPASRIEAFAVTFFV